MSNKNIDKGNKRRFVKNILRFIKHPLAYTYWKWISTWAPGKRLLHFLLALMAINEFRMYLVTSQERVQKAEFMTVHGINVDGDRTQRLGFYDQELSIPNMHLLRLLYSPMVPTSIVASPANSQAHRKHFDLRRYYGLNK